eukprot:2919448-Amphidinium_carterae.1
MEVTIASSRSRQSWETEVLMIQLCFSSKFLIWQSGDNLSATCVVKLIHRCQIYQYADRPEFGAVLELHKLMQAVLSTTAKNESVVLQKRIRAIGSQEPFKVWHDHSMYYV